MSNELMKRKIDKREFAGYEKLVWLIQIGRLQL
jgi:hypothetical protein